MKKKSTLLSCAFLLVAAVMFAQPVLTSTGIHCSVGEQFTLSTGTNYDAGSPGANQIWDFSGMSVSGTSVTTMVEPSTTLNASYFPDANISSVTTESDAVSYTKQTASLMQICGGSGNSNLFVYNDPEDFLRFPFTYNDTYVDTWETVFESSGYTFYRTGITTVTADGYGTLITPEGTINDVLRVHYVQEYQDSTYIGMPYIITYYNDEYMWYKNGIHYQLAFVYELTSSQGTSMTAGKFLSGITGVNNEVNNSALFSIYPNPATDFITVAFPVNEYQNSEVRLINITGQQIDIRYVSNYSQESGIIQLDIAAIPDGIYFAQLITDGVVVFSEQVIKSAGK